MLAASCSGFIISKGICLFVSQCFASADPVRSSCRQQHSNIGYDQNNYYPGDQRKGGDGQRQGCSKSHVPDQSSHVSRQHNEHTLDDASVDEHLEKKTKKCFQAEGPSIVQI